MRRILANDPRERPGGDDMSGDTNGGRTRAYQALRESEELHRATLSSISDAVFLADEDGAFTFICPNVDVIFGYAPDEVQAMGRYLEDRRATHRPRSSQARFDPECDRALYVPRHHGAQARGKGAGGDAAGAGPRRTTGAGGRADGIDRARDPATTRGYSRELERRHATHKERHRGPGTCGTARDVQRHPARKQ